MPGLKTIAVTAATKARLDAAKLVPTESYESVISRHLALAEAVLSHDEVAEPHPAKRKKP